jgi:hypothetical protein
MEDKHADKKKRRTGAKHNERERERGREGEGERDRERERFTITKGMQRFPRTGLSASVSKRSYLLYRDPK